MGLNSMTGFARGDGASGAWRWHWEVKTVNGRGLDIRCRLPAGFEALEPAIREQVSGRLHRGNCQIALQLTSQAGATQVSVNRQALDTLVAVAQDLRSQIDAPPVTAEGLLSLRGVIEVAEPLADEGERVDLAEAILASLDPVLAALSAARAAEGDRLRAVVESQIDTIATLTDRARAAPSRQPEAIRARLAEQVSRLIAETSSLDEERLHQEAILLAARADIREELDRLEAHVAAARELIGAEGPTGRKLDFLSQEFNREANTLCSKANDAALSALGLELKATVDQLREQVQNIE